jgi:RNase adaptor protein for sRNA GlmZ degradation
MNIYSYKLRGPHTPTVPKYCKINATKLRNPWHRLALRKLDGKQPAVQEFLLGCRRTLDILASTSFKYLSTYSTLWIGCNNGRQRSVALAEMIGARIKAYHKDYDIQIIHLDLPGEPFQG